MPKILFTGDLHFGHKSIITFNGRPFESVEEMDCELTRRWNAKVSKDDLIYILGDMIWKSRNDDAPNIIRSLNGQKVLIRGNHDKFLNNAKATREFVEIKDYDSISVTLQDGTIRRCFLSHFFTPMYDGHFYKAIHLHAHSHFTEESDCELEIAKKLNDAGFYNEIYNVGCMYWNYEPVTLDEILAKGISVHPAYLRRIAERGPIL